MNFVSIPFVVLLTLVILIIATVKTPSSRKFILLVACCVFYGYWDWRFLFLLAAFTILNYYISYWMVISGTPKTHRILFVVGIVLNLGFLGVFKYFNFFIDSLNFLLTPIQWKIEILKTILPLGISFYIFETLSYLIDVYRGTSAPAQSLSDYALFVAFFPRLMSGPLVRAKQFFSQLEDGIWLNFSNFLIGGQLFLRGMLKKLVVADNMAIMTDIIFNSPAAFSSVTIWVGVLAYSIQIYFDFSGYTDMAIGVGKIIGFDLPQNFNLPYTSLSITEFWRRWHITLSTWFRDYVFYPLEISRARKFQPPFFQYLNIIIVFLLTGLWHGAGWNFVIWGGLHGIYLVIERIIYKGKSPSGQWTSPLTWLKALATFILISITWIFFRASSIQIAGEILQKLVFINPTGVHWMFTPALLLIPLTLIGGFMARLADYRFPILMLDKSYTLAVIMAQILIIFFFAARNTSPFIYFQF